MSVLLPAGVPSLQAIPPEVAGAQFPSIPADRVGDDEFYRRNLIATMNFIVFTFKEETSWSAQEIVGMGDKTDPLDKGTYRSRLGKPFLPVRLNLPNVHRFEDFKFDANGVRQDESREVVVVKDGGNFSNIIDALVDYTYGVPDFRIRADVGLIPVNAWANYAGQPFGGDVIIHGLTYIAPRNEYYVQVRQLSTTRRPGY